MSIPLRGETDPLTQVRQALWEVDDPQVAAQGQRLLSTVEKMIQRIPPEELALRHIPPLRAHKGGDGSLSVEWVFADFRVGFNIEPSPEDSGWHLVSGKRLGEITASGHLSSMSEIVAVLLDFILSNV